MRIGEFKLLEWNKPIELVFNFPISKIFWSRISHKFFPLQFKIAVFYLVTSLKVSFPNLKIPKFVIFEILKNMNQTWFKNNPKIDEEKKCQIN